VKRASAFRTVHLLPQPALGDREHAGNHAFHYANWCMSWGRTGEEVEGFTKHVAEPYRRRRVTCLEQ